MPSHAKALRQQGNLKVWVGLILVLRFSNEAAAAHAVQHT
jgi:hypothetical protein